MYQGRRSTTNGVPLVGGNPRGVQGTGGSVQGGLEGSYLRFRKIAQNMSFFFEKSYIFAPMPDLLRDRSHMITVVIKITYI